ncbi:MAG: 2-amino-4-hydroxy-6-hydroxymethyldihydropteridine diphosphokinase [Candidatus Omnitrophica bacterium]|nr:2-amino-4-hydroxy-6-hydroxymethyldihydropteridine diphosphokinase [Candidatus Omnitrophota bacterium]
MSIVYLGLGSNVGNREENILAAVKGLEAGGIKVIKLSSIIETDPVGGPVQGLFLNAVLKAETSLPPLELLKTCQGIENALGRVRVVNNGPRTIDIDILLYDDLKLNVPGLVIPHPRMYEREFVTRPLQEVI